jgi:cell division septal protein FtsQ
MSISDKYLKDYKDTDFRNPRLQKERDSRQRLKSRLFFGSIVFSIAGLFYFLFYSPYFELKEISVNGLQQINPETMKEMIDEYRIERHWLIFSHNCYWFFDKDELAKKITEKYWIDYIDMKKLWPNRIIIDVGERESAVNWLSGDKCYRLDLTATAIEFCEAGSALMTIKDLNEMPVEIGKSPLSEDLLEQLIRIDQSLKMIAANYHFKISNYEIKDKSLEVKIADGFSVFFNLAQSDYQQIERLELLMKQNDVLENLAKLQYIDLRFGEKLFYK